MAKKAKAPRARSNGSSPDRKKLPIHKIVELRGIKESIDLQTAKFNYKIAEMFSEMNMPISTSAICFSCHVARQRDQPCDCPLPGQQVAQPQPATELSD